MERGRLEVVWIGMVHFCDENPTHVAVVNSAARSNAGMGKYGVTLKKPWKNYSGS